MWRMSLIYSLLLKPPLGGGTVALLLHFLGTGLDLGLAFDLHVIQITIEKLKELSIGPYSPDLSQVNNHFKYRDNFPTQPIEQFLIQNIVDLIKKT